MRPVLKSSIALGAILAVAAVVALRFWLGVAHRPIRPAYVPRVGTGQEAPADLLAPLPGTDVAAFQRGRALFEKEFTAAEGLGPYYNASSCRACHNIPAVGGQGDHDHHVGQDEARPRHTPAGETVYRPDEPAHVPPSLFGLALLDDLTDDQITRGCGVDAALGIHGIAGGNGNKRTPPVKRFGRGARTRDLRAFVAKALLTEQGLTNPGTPDEPKTCGHDPEHPEECKSGDAVDVPDSTIDDLVAFVGGLAPVPRLPPDPRGEKLFAQVGCATCHRVDAPYFLGTDVCLHDMGALKEPTVPPRPPPRDFVRLWVTARLSGVRFRAELLHDGRASNVDEAIRAHDGEGAIVKDAYAALAEADRRALVAYVMSL